jgi:CheY-like chemotaxis protein
VGHVATTLNGANGDFVERVKQIKPDLISMDIVMPGRDGFEAISLLKQNKGTERIPVFFLTNLGLAKEINEGLERGATDYLLTQLLSLGDIVKIYTDYLDDPKNYLQRAQYFLSAIQNGE